MPEQCAKKLGGNFVKGAKEDETAFLTLGQRTPIRGRLHAHDLRFYHI